MPESRFPLFFGRSPLTDLRSLTSSALFHVLVVLLASLKLLNATPSPEASGARALHAEFDSPVDNRPDLPSTPGEGGGSPGEIGGLGVVPIVPPLEGTIPERPIRDLTADTLLTEVLPPAQPKLSESLQRPLPGPETSGQGLIPGSGSGGGGGAGGGSGGGRGRSIGPGTQFFGASDHARSFAYVIDCSGSMATRNSLQIAKRELLASVGHLPPDAQFAVILYNLQARVIADPQGRKVLMAATAANKAWVESKLAPVAPDGGTDHMVALRSALGLKPEVIFFLTDADLMTDTDIDEILTEVGPTRIQAVEFGHGTDLGRRTPLGRLAITTGGSYRYIDVMQFPRSDAGF